MNTPNEDTAQRAMQQHLEQQRCQPNRANEPAYPSDKSDEGDYNRNHSGWHGLTIREHFAALAMQAILSNTLGFHSVDSKTELAVYAVECADALIAELAK